MIAEEGKEGGGGGRRGEEEEEKKEEEKKKKEEKSSVSSQLLNLRRFLKNCMRYFLIASFNSWHLKICRREFFFFFKGFLDNAFSNLSG